MEPAFPAQTRAPATGCGYFVCAVLVLGGVALLWVAQDKWQTGRAQEAWITGGFGAFFCAFGVGLIAPIQRAAVRARERRRREQAEPHRPWTWDPNWTDERGVPQARRRSGGVLLFIGIMFLALSLPIAAIAVPTELARQNYAVLLALLFPLIGVWMLALAVLDAVRRRKYGVARFVPGGLPVPLGGTLAGMIVVSRAIVPTGPGRVNLDCWRTQLTRRGSKSRQQATVVATTERELGADACTTTAGESQIFVELPLRGGSATTMHTLTTDRPTYEWRLQVAVPTAGADFVGEFVLPVFPVAGAASPGEPPPKKTSADRAEIWKTAGVCEEPQPGAKNGRALLLPAGVGRVAVWLPLVMGLLLGGVAIALWWSGIWFIAMFVSLFALAPLLAIGPLWNGGGERLWVESDALCVQRAGGAVRRLPHAEIGRLESVASVSVGNRKFYRVQARCHPAPGRRREPRFEFVSLVRGEEAATEILAWLGEQGVVAPPVARPPQLA